MAIFYGDIAVGASDFMSGEEVSVVNYAVYKDALENNTLDPAVIYMTTDDPNEIVGQQFDRMGAFQWQNLSANIIDKIDSTTAEMLGRYNNLSTYVQDDGSHYAGFTYTELIPGVYFVIGSTASKFAADPIDAEQPVGVIVDFKSEFRPLEHPKFIELHKYLTGAEDPFSYDSDAGTFQICNSKPEHDGCIWLGMVLSKSGSMNVSPLN